ncbi:MAG: choloylglycine hydrolase [Clostridia bacterium]|nr:choloylglycine hydrolase [Clostridia bacterium]
MCTAVTYNTKDFYFGRTLDIERSYNEEVVVTPRNYLFKFRHTKEINNHFAIIGMAYVANNFPLYFDAANEQGLCIAGLNFVGNAKYNKSVTDKINIAQFEYIPYILSKCATVEEAVLETENINITNTPFSSDLPPAELHFIIADKNRAVTVESVSDGIKIHKNPVGVLTNNPPFDMQLFTLNNYMKISPKSPSNEFSNKIELNSYSRGMGAIGLPGDLSSNSRFIRAAFTKLNSVSQDDEASSISQFFHIMGSVEQVRGCCEVEGKYELTTYASCINATKGIYYYATYENRQISAVNLKKINPYNKTLIRYPLLNKQNIFYQN